MYAAAERFPGSSRRELGGHRRQGCWCDKDHLKCNWEKDRGVSGSLVILSPNRRKTLFSVGIRGRQEPTNKSQAGWGKDEETKWSLGRLAT